MAKFSKIIGRTRMLRSVVAPAGAMALATLMALIILLSGGLTSCSHNEWRRSEGAVWNTIYHITYDAPRDLSDSIQAIFRRIDLSVSPFNDQSVVSRVNRGENPDVDADFRNVFLLSQQVNDRTDGLFDPTVSPIINLWKFGYTGKVEVDSVFQPSAAEIDSALALVGIQNCKLLADNTISLKGAGTTFNFSAIAKGYACDEIAAMLRRNGSTGAMVEIGGEIAIFGMNPQGEEWRIQIDTPEIEDGAPQHNRLDVLQLTDCGIATSGNYRNYHQSADGRVGHTLSPVTGRPVMGEILSVTVVAPTCAEADAYATASMAAGTLAEARRLLERNRLRAIVVTATPDGTLHSSYI